jgi:membrane-associated phospholipid phosphatase
MQTIVRLLADGLIIPIILLAGYALLFKIPSRNRFEAYKRIFLAGLTAYLFAKLLAAVYQPSSERPFEAMGIAAGASFLPNPGFPSDHALFTTFLTLAVWFETRRKNIAITMGILTLLVCLGRVLAFVHTPLDVIGGIIVAFMGVIWYVQGSSSVASHRAPSKNDL